MGSRGVLRKNYFIYPETVMEFGAEIENVMTETDRAMEEASEIIAKMASVTERIPSQVRSGELLELCETAQAEIRSFDFLSYGKRVHQGLQNLVDRNEYITNNFIKRTEANIERICEFGAACRRLTELIDYSGGSLPLKGLALSAVNEAENENTDGEGENDSSQSWEGGFIRAGAAEALEISTEEVMAEVEKINRYNSQYNNNLGSGKRVLSNYMEYYGIAEKEEIDSFTEWLVEERPELLVELYVVDSKSSRDAVYVIDKIMNLYKTLLGAEILTNYLDQNCGDIKDEDKPELIVPFLYFFHADKLINLYELEKLSEQENNCQELIGFYLDKRTVLDTRRGTIFYAYTWLQINSIESFTHDDFNFDQLVEKFVGIYEDHIGIYNKIAEETGVPPEVVAVIHYRENSDDFLKENFDAFLQNGKVEGVMSEDEFIQNAIEAIQSKQYCIYAYNLSYDSNDIVAMVCFAEAYNGMGSYDNDLISAYSYSGTDVYVSGKYISDGNFDQDVIDQQVGTYRLLLAAVAGIYDAEDGKNYVNKMCGGNIQ